MDDQVTKLLKDSKALLEGHFLLSSGLHSRSYMQLAKVLQNPINAEILGKLLKEKLDKEIGLEPDLIVAPAMGGLIIGHEVARAYSKNFIFSERVDGEMVIRRGFQIPKGSKIIIVEDVFTTGKSTNEVIALLKKYEADIIACCSIINRTGTVKFSVPHLSLKTYRIINYKPENCPFCRGKLKTPLEKPGSRNFK